MSDSPLTPAEAALRLGVAVGTLARWRRTGLVPYMRLPGGGVRYDAATIDAVRANQPAA